MNFAKKMSYPPALTRLPPPKFTVPLKRVATMMEQGVGGEAEFNRATDRVKLVWASAAEGARFASETTLFVEEIRKLGPLNWGKPGESVDSL